MDIDLSRERAMLNVLYTSASIVSQAASSSHPGYPNIQKISYIEAWESVEDRSRLHRTFYKWWNDQTNKKNSLSLSLSSDFEKLYKYFHKLSYRIRENPNKILILRTLINTEFLKSKWRIVQELKNFKAPRCVNNNQTRMFRRCQHSPIHGSVIFSSDPLP